MFKKSLCAVFAAMLLYGCGTLSSKPNSPQQQVIFVSADISITMKESGLAWGTNDKSYHQANRGTAFAAEIANKRYLVTAAHVLSINPKASSLSIKGKLIALGTDKKGLPIMTEQHTGIRIGELSIIPASVRFDFSHDLAVMELSQDDWEKLDGIVLHTLSKQSPSVEDEVKVWGFNASSSAAQQLKTAKVNFVTDLIIDVNQPVEGGFSGGPLLDQSNRVIGVVVRSEAAAALAVPVDFLKSVVDMPPCKKDNRGWRVP
jgi:hypothetical protein